MSVHLKYQIDMTNSNIFPIKSKKNYFYSTPSLIWRLYEQCYLDLLFRALESCCYSHFKWQIYFGEFCLDIRGSKKSW